MSNTNQINQITSQHHEFKAHACSSRVKGILKIKISLDEAQKIHQEENYFISITYGLLNIKISKTEEALSSGIVDGNSIKIFVNKDIDSPICKRIEEEFTEIKLSFSYHFPYQTFQIDIGEPVD